MEQRWQQNYELYRKYLEATVNIYKSRRDVRMFTELLLSLGAVIVFIIFAIRPTLVTIAGLTTEISEKKKTVAQLDQKIESLVAAQTNYEENKSAINLLNYAIPPGPYPQLFIRQIEGVAQKNSVSVSSVNMSDVAVKGVADVKNVSKTSEEKVYDMNSVNIPVAISVSGDYQSILGFVSDVENLRRIILPESIELFTREETGSDIVYVNINGRIVFRNK